ncbi:MAG: hypothetical protein VX815_12550 [Gemmatimonadota bacterium]|nr:hypothetical protein [Gemmatimonadota bacterium]
MRSEWRVAFSMLVTLMLALGIGGTVAFWSEYKWRREEFDLVKGVPEGFESVAAYSNQAYTLRTDAGSSLVRATVASVELFDVLSRLGPSVPVERELDFTRPVSGLEAEDQILELARLGEKLAAVGLARRTFGFSLAEATGFVEDLLGPGSEPSPWAGI